MKKAFISIDEIKRVKEKRRCSLKEAIAYLVPRPCYYHAWGGGYIVQEKPKKTNKKNDAGRNQD